MGRRVALSALADAPVEDVPGHSSATLVRLRPAQIAPTPLNSRSNFGTPEVLAGLGESMRVRQLQPVVIVARADYLRLWPEHDAKVGTADYVLVNGERRWRAARHTGLDRLDALIRPEVADSRPAFLDAIFTENLDRQNLDPIEEARAVEEMVTECGSATAAAERFRRHESWISQRRALLRLTPDLQGRVRAGEIPVRIARSIAAVPAGQQEAAWQAARAAEAEQRAERKQSRAPRSRKPAASQADEGAADPAATNPGPPPRALAARDDSGEAIPWHSPKDLAGIIRARLAPAAVAELATLLSA
jgi:ParB family chromosome partitioning protein